jgi:tRNA(Leu) C34 or U34 (ribose-2'-O)-methylase TrmL
MLVHHILRSMACGVFDLRTILERRDSRCGIRYKSKILPGFKTRLGSIARFMDLMTSRATGSMNFSRKWSLFAPIPCSPERFPPSIYVADTDTPQGVVAIAGIPDSDLCLHGSPLVVLADEIRDPGNLGTLIRSADAFGLRGIILSGDVVDPFNAKCVRATMGSIFRVPLVSFKRAEDSIKFLKGHEFSIVAADIKADTTCYDYDFRGKCGILVGSEAHGLTCEILKLCDQTVRIPMIGDAESLNAGVAGSILMYEAYRQRRSE